VKFQNPSLQKRLVLFVECLSKLNNHVAQHTAPVLVGGKTMTGYKPDRIVAEDEYQRLRKLADEANSFSDAAWEQLEDLVQLIRIEVPECFDENI
jgi:hypothetical protein